MKKISNCKGITLIILTLYVILTFIILSILGTLMANFRRNVQNVDITTLSDLEFDKINFQLLKETKIEKNDVEEIQNGISFSNGNTYIYDEEDDTIYLNGNIKIAEKISAADFEINEGNGKKELKIEIEIGGTTRESKYIINND